MTTQDRYRHFAEVEAAGRSALYVEWASAIADDLRACTLIDGFPAEKRQANLWFAAIRVVHGDVLWSARLLDDPEVQRIVRTRRTQTNEPARCATLLPLLCSLPQPLALLEIGASAGLCLLPDRYGYRYPDRTLRGGPPEFPCAVTGPAPLPDALPSVVWRRGLDLNPLSPTTDADWLRALVWPGQYERLARLEQALAIAVADPPEIVRGDLRTDLPALAATAPPDATLVVFHTAVLAYLARDERPAVADTIRATGARWIANEGPPVLRGWLPDAPDDGTEDFVLRLDGEPVARTDGHGAYLHWLSDLVGDG
ncbi:MAG TPA: DUF2332 domain-containing protein [Mycobacteriales bacterium]